MNNNSKWFIVIPPYGAAHILGKEIYKAFENILDKNRIKLFDCSKYLFFFNNILKNPDQTMAVDLLNQSMLTQCIDFKPDHILVCALSPITLFILNILKKQNINTVHWFYEDYKRALYWKDVLDGYNFFFGIQKGEIKLECEQKNIKFYYLPTAASYDFIELSQNSTQTKNFDVAFIGFASEYRIEFLEYLYDEGISIIISGSGWEGYNGRLKKNIISTNWVNNKEAKSIYQKSKIGINISFNSPQSNKENVQISPRVFDILASNCVLFTEDIMLAQETLNNLHYYTFSSKEDCLKKIKAVLNDYDKEKMFFEHNRQEILKNHTYENRVKKIIELCEK
jgi:spore maturation protein CgeB